MTLPIRFKNRYPEVGEELVMETDFEPFFYSWLEFMELSSYVDEGKVRHNEGGKLLELAKVDIVVSNERFHDVSNAHIKTRPKQHGYLHGFWDGLLIRHSQYHDWLYGHWCRKEDCFERYAYYKYGKHVADRTCEYGAKLSGKFETAGDKKIWRFYWELGRNAKGSGHSILSSDATIGDGYLELERDDLLRGLWWPHGETEEAAKDNPYRQLYLKRAEPYQKEPFGLVVPVRFGKHPNVIKLWFSEQKLIEEVTSFLKAGKTRYTKSACTLEIGYRYLHREHRLDKNGFTWSETNKYEQDASGAYAEYPVKLNGKLKTDLVNSLLYLKGWQHGARLITADSPGWPKFKEELRRATALVAPGVKKWWKTKAFRKPYYGGKKQGHQDFQAVRDSLITRFAADGLLPEDDNKFEKGKPDWLEFEIYRSLRDEEMFASDYFVEVYEHARTDEQFPGASWAFGPGTYSAKEGDFAALALSAVHVPQDCTLTLYGAEDKKLSLGPGFHNLPPHSFNDLTLRLEVAYTSTRFYRPPPTWWLAAFLRGRQLRRIRIAAVVSTSSTPSARLITQSNALGISQQDVNATYNTALEDSKRFRLNQLVLMYCALGFKDRKNPFEGVEDMGPSRDLFNEVADKVNHEDYIKSRDRGLRLNKTFQLGKDSGYNSYTHWGSGDLAPKIPRQFLKAEADACEVKVNVLEEMFLNAFRVGRQRKIGELTYKWLTTKLNRKALNKAVAAVIKRCVVDQKKWGPWTKFPKSVSTERGSSSWSEAALVYQHDWHEFEQLKKTALKAGVPEPTFMLQRNRLLRWELPGAQEIYDNDTTFNFLANFAISIPLNVFETLTAAACCVADIMAKPIYLLADMNTWHLSGEFANWCYDSFENSAFRRIRHDTSGAGLLGYALLQSAETVLIVYGASALRVALSKGAAVSLTQLSARQFFSKSVWRTMLHGGVQWVRANGAKMVAASAVPGAAEEAIHAWMDEREFNWSYALRNTLRNSAMFLMFNGLHGAFKKAAMQNTFSALALSYAALGYMRSALDVYEAIQSGDEEQWNDAWKALVTEFLLDVVLDGATGIGSTLVRESLNKTNKVKPNGKLLKRLAEVPEKFDRKASKYIYSFAKKLKDDLKGVVNWSLREWPVGSLAFDGAPIHRVHFSVEYGDNQTQSPSNKGLGERRTVDHFPALSLKLTERDHKAIDSHEGLKSLDKQFPDGGKGAVFFMADLAKTTLQKSKVGWGEGGQAKFLQKLLERRFPNAEFIAGDQPLQADKSHTVPKDAIPADMRDKDVYLIRVRDKAQDGHNILQSPSSQHVEMAFLKAANSAADISYGHKSKVRRVLGLGEGDLVISVYWRRFYHQKYGQGAVELKQIVDALKKVKPGRKVRVILSQAGNVGFDGAPPHFDKAFAGDVEHHTVGIDDETVSNINTDKVAIIYNQTRGRMPHLHAAADAAIVIGSINPFESLAAGTPTVQLLADRTKYNKNTLRYYDEVGKQSGAYQQLWSKTEAQRVGIEQALRDVIDQTPKTFHHKTIDFGDGGGSSSAFGRLLDNITHVLEHAKPQQTK